MEQPNWSLLLPELIQLISEKIFCISDYIYFRDVCWPWRLASLPKPCHLPPQLPWLLLPKPIIEPEVVFYDLYRSKMSTIRHPLFQDSHISGASLGWLVLEKKQDVILFNPVIKASILVASLSGVPNILPLPEKRKLSPPDWVIAENNSQSYMRKAILTSTPSPDTECIVVGLFRSNWCMAFCRLGDENWTLIEEFNEDGAPFIADISWLHNMLYTIDMGGRVYIYDLYSPAKQYVSCVDMYSPWSARLVEGASEPMVVVRLYPGSHIYEVSKWWNEGQPDWHQTYEIGNAVLFLTHTSHHCISIPCDYLQSKKWHGNQICSAGISSIKLQELGDGYPEDIANFEVPNVRLLDRWFWVTPSY